MLLIVLPKEVFKAVLLVILCFIMTRMTHHIYLNFANAAAFSLNMLFVIKPRNRFS